MRLLSSLLLLLLLFGAREYGTQAHGGLIHIKPNKERYARQIALKASPEDIKFALQSSRIFKTLIGCM